jgi:hypothetical protein
MPCSARPAISAPAEGASAHSAEVATKPPMPASSTRRRPNASPNRLPAIRHADMASV